VVPENRGSRKKRGVISWDMIRGILRSKEKFGEGEGTGGGTSSMKSSSEGEPYPCKGGSVGEENRKGQREKQSWELQLKSKGADSWRRIRGSGWVRPNTFVI